MVVLYSTGCTNCNILKKQLDNSGIEYEINSNTKEMIELGITDVPVLGVNGRLLDRKEAIVWIKEQEASNEKQ